jgi:hypothetical protein
VAHTDAVNFGNGCNSLLYTDSGGGTMVSKVGFLAQKERPPTAGGLSSTSTESFSSLLYSAVVELALRRRGGAGLMARPIPVGSRTSTYFSATTAVHGGGFGGPNASGG